MSDMYQPPSSELTRSDDAVGAGASLERALSGDFDFQPTEIVSESGKLLSGSKLPILVGAVAAYAVSFVVQLTGTLLWEPISPFGILSQSIALGVLQAVVTAPLYGGLIYMGIRRWAGDEITVGDVGSQWHRATSLALTMLLSMVLIYAGFLLLILPGIYLSIAYVMALPLVIDKGLSPWQALEASRKAINHCWFRMLGLMFLIGLIVVLGAVLLLVGLIWAIPLANLSVAGAYRSIFGISSSADGSLSA